MKKFKTSKTRKKVKASVQIMQETFVMVSFAFILGTVLSGAFLWFVTQELVYQPQLELQQETKIKTELELENVHYDSSSVTREDYDLIDYLVTLESALNEYCSGVNLDSESEALPECPMALENLIPKYITNAESVGGDLSIFKYFANGQEFEINVKLGDGAKELMKNDNGDNDDYFELGTDLTLIQPTAND